jgi:sugar-specific transcriptional regulator TrmB
MELATIEGTLSEVGLTINEAKVYLALIRLAGFSKASEISKETGLPRTFIYEILKSLLFKGIATYVIKAGVKYYEAAEPDRLKAILKEKEQKLSSILPALKELKPIIREKPNTELYEGKEGLKTILEDILKMKPGSVCCSYSSYKIFEVLRFFFPNFIRRRIKGKIKSRMIQEKKPEFLKFISEFKQTHLDIRFTKAVPAASIFIYDNKVAFLTMREDAPIGVLIKDKEIFATQLQLFEQLWKASSPIY